MDVEVGQWGDQARGDRPSGGVKIVISPIGGTGPNRVDHGFVKYFLFPGVLLIVDVKSS